MSFKLVLDTNVLLSGLLFGGIPGQILDLALEGDLHLVISAPLLSELERVLRNKFPSARQTIWDTVGMLKEVAFMTAPQEQIHAISEDPSDNRILECAVSAHAEAIISGDRHLLALQSYRHIPILTPQAFLAGYRR